MKIKKNTIATKTIGADDGRSPSRNTESKIRSNGYVTMLPSLFNSKIKRLSAILNALFVSLEIQQATQGSDSFKTTSGHNFYVAS